MSGPALAVPARPMTTASRQHSHVTPSPRAGRSHATRGSVSPIEWGKRRPEITELYRHRSWTLARVMKEMESRGFYAS